MSIAPVTYHQRPHRCLGSEWPVLSPGVLVTSWPGLLPRTKSGSVVILKIESVLMPKLLLLAMSASVVLLQLGSVLAFFVHITTGAHRNIVLNHVLKYEG